MAFQLAGRDNFIHMLDDRPEVMRCPSCDVPTHPFEHGFPQPKVPKKKDLSNCVESFKLASPRVKSFLEEHCTSPIEYYETGGGYFILRPVWSVFLDLSFGHRPDEPWRRTLATGFCATCGRHISLTGTPNGIMEGQRNVGEFDLVRGLPERGNFKQRMFSIIAGDGLVKAMKAEKFKGAAYAPLDGS